MYYTNLQDNDDYTGYRLDVKRRLNIIYHKQLGDIKKMEKAKIDTDWLRVRLPTLKQRIEQLQQEYETIEKEYQLVIEKLHLV